LCADDTNAKTNVPYYYNQQRVTTKHASIAAKPKLNPLIFLKCDCSGPQNPARNCRTSAVTAFDVGFHDQLQDGFSDAAKKVAAILLCEQFGKVHVGFGHRGLRVVRG
jgi:hypothetical protein